MRRGSFGKWSLLLLLFVCFGPDWAAGNQIYRWVDEKGVVHFSDRKPDDGAGLKGPVEERAVGEPVSKEEDANPPVDSKVRSPIEYAALSTFTIKGSKGLGAGFFISPEGYAVTCRHVLQEGSHFTAVLQDQKEYPVTIISEHPRYDLALILILNQDSAPRLDIRDSGTLVTGERIFAIGAPAGLQSTVTDGVFTGFRENGENGGEVIQFSAPINPGSSGGPLVDESGKVVGVVTWKYAQKGDVPLAGLSFALPSAYILEHYKEYIQ